MAVGFDNLNAGSGLTQYGGCSEACQACADNDYVQDMFPRRLCGAAGLTGFLVTSSATVVSSFPKTVLCLIS
jgi:hypothetical protein